MLLIYPSYKKILENKISNKILSTLWNNQKIYGQNDNHNTRWSFCKLNDTEFEICARKLLWAGLIIPNKNQYMLSNVGIRFCQKYDKHLLSDNMYSSFSN